MNKQKLIEIEKANKVIFVGDTHGDWEISQKIIKNYLKSDNASNFQKHPIWMSLHCCLYTDF